MPEILTVGNVSAKPGETKIGPAFSVELRDGTPVSLPVILVNGAEKGPTLVITAAVHPTELVGVEAVRVVTREILDPKKLKGRIIAFPLTNPLGLQFGEYTSPHDKVNMSVAYPGSAQGTLTSRLANFIWENATKKATLCMDFHENVKPCLHFSIVGYSKSPEVEKQALEAAKAFGITVIRPAGARFELPGTKPGDLSYSSTCMANGIPAFTPEFEASTELTMNRDEEVTIQVAVRGLLNVMKLMKMIPGSIEEQTGIQVLRGNFEFKGMTKANRGGIVHRLVKTGVKLKKGTPIAKIYSIYGDVVETIEMPFDGYVWGWTLRREWLTAQTGHTISFCFTEV
jgi:predicted deacylase